VVKPFNMYDFGTRLAGCCARKGVNQAALAALVGLKSPHLISNLERGTKVQRWAETVMRLVQVLEVSTNYLLGFVEDDADLLVPRRMTVRRNAPGDTRGAP
jgi:transcriptional regulator with XRE-family HTH domain